MDIVADGYTRAFRDLVRWFRAEVERCVLFDFDGPICRLFPDGSSERVAHDLRAHVRRREPQGALSLAVERSPDPHEVLRAMGHMFPGSELVAELEELLTEGELTAARTAPPTPGAHRLIRELRAGGVRIAVVTNNSPRAVAAYLHRHGLADAFGPHLYGRTGNTLLLKPDPDSLQRALHGLYAEPADALMIGDTVSDLAAARDAKVSFVGYARNARKEAPLRAAGADIILPGIEPLLELAVRHPS